MVQLNRKLNPTRIRWICIIALLLLIFRESQLLFEQKSLESDGSHIYAEILEVYCNPIKSSIAILYYKNKEYKVSPFREFCNELRSGDEIKVLYSTSYDRIFLLGSTRTRYRHLIFLFIAMGLFVLSPEKWLILQI